MRFLVVGNYIDDEIKNKRGLPSSNPAGSNRIFNIASVMGQSNDSTLILSSGSAANIKFNKKLLHKYEIRRVGNNILIFSSALSIPYLSIFYEQLSIIYIFLKLFKKYKLNIIILYCYYPSTIFVGLIAKLLNIKIIEDLQDIVKPKLSDFWKNSILFGFQQYFGMLLMTIVLLISNIILVPSNRFIRQKYKKKYLKVDGCINFNEIDICPSYDAKLKVLYSGLINEENGRNLFLETLYILDKKINFEIEFHITGIIEDEENFISKLKEFTNLTIYVHGFLSVEKFKLLLKSINICLVLQDPYGRNRNAKTPSKGFEYLSNGKAVICSLIGDFPEIPNDCIIFLENYDKQALANILLNVPKIDINKIMVNAAKYSKENWDFNVVQKNIFYKLDLF